MSEDVIVRAYLPPDRPALRGLACDTANRGRPVETFFPDREVFADLITRYYTEYEPKATWIAEAGGRLVGYLTGCLDTHRYWRIMARRVIPQTVGKAILRGTFASRRTWRLIGAGIETSLRGGWRREVLPSRYAAHLHVNVRQEFRGRSVGRRLVERFCEHARAAGGTGVHLGVREENTAACRFFERLGFTLLHRYPLACWDEAGHSLGATRVYGKPL